MLGADLIGFHLQQYCNNFLDTIDRMLEARLDRDHFVAEVRGRATRVRPLPISVQPWAWIASTIPRAFPSGSGPSPTSSTGIRSIAAA